MNFKLLIASILLTIPSYGQPDNNSRYTAAEIDHMWIEFKTKYGKSYKDVSQDMHRRKIFIENINAIEAHNELFSQGLTSYTAGINQFQDLEGSEFTETMTCANANGRATCSTNKSKFSMFQAGSKTIPESLDWREHGRVTPIKNQGLSCKSCWAFAATGALEGQILHNNKTPVPLSEQNLIDCSIDFGNEGCDGGSPAYAFDYVTSNSGINTNESYPYEAKKATCRYNSDDIGGTCSSYTCVSGEDMLLKAVAEVGPVVTLMFLDESLSHYNGFIYDNTSCHGTLNHAALVVGYGKNASSGKEYWIIKNSYGDTWGVKGYLYIERNKSICEIGERVYPAYGACQRNCGSAVLITCLLLRLLFIRY